LNIQTTPDTLNFYLKDTGARIALCEAALADKFGAEVLDGTAVAQVVTVNGVDDGTQRIAAVTFLYWPAEGHRPSFTMIWPILKRRSENMSLN